MFNILNSDNATRDDNSSEAEQDNTNVSDVQCQDLPTICGTSHSKGCPPSKPPRRKHSGQLTPCKDTEFSPTQSGDASVSHSLSPKIINRGLLAEKINSSSATIHCEENKDLAESEGVFSPEVNYFDGSTGEFLSLPKPSFLDQNLTWEKHCTSPQNSVVYNSLPFTISEHKPSYNASVNSIYYQNLLLSPFHNGVSSDPICTQPSYHSNSGVHSLPPFIHQYSTRDSGFDRYNENRCSQDLFNENSKKDMLGNFIMKVDSLKPPCHRRHHSDPVLSWDHKLTKKSSLGRISSHHSHSFIGASPKKMLRRMSIESLKNQKHFNGIKHPLLLNAELKALQDINEKLWQHLHSTQSQLDMLQKFKNLSKMDSARRTQFSDLLAEIYYAQKERDQAIHARLRLVTQERDVALKQLQQLLQCLGSGLKEEIDSSDEDDDDDDEQEVCFEEENEFLKMNLLPHQRVDKLLKHLETTQSPTRLIHQKENLLANINKARDYRKHRLSQELRVILAERDAAMEKARSLEEELSQWQHSNSIWQADTKQWETDLLDTLRQVIAERDVAVSKVGELQEKLHLCYNLQSSFMGIGKQEKEQVQLPQNTDTSGDAIQKTYGESTLITTLLQSSLNPEEKVHLQNEISTLNTQLEAEKQARKEAEEKYQRLERLVNVLQKRVNGLNVGVQV